MSEIVNGNPLDKNKSGKANPKTTNFPINYHLYGTYRFGEYGFCFGYNGIPKDKVRIRQNCNVNTYTLKAPLLTPITMNRTYIQVPRQAIIPNAWEKIFTNPSIGEDIDASEYGTSVKATYVNAFTKSLTDELKQKISFFFETYTDEGATVSEILNSVTDIINSLVKNELVFSNGSLINAMGAHFNMLWNEDRGEDFDTTFENILNGIKNIGAIEVRIDNKSYTWIIAPSETGLQRIKNVSNYKIINTHQLLEILRDGEPMEAGTGYTKEGLTLSVSVLITALSSFNDLLDDYFQSIKTPITYGKPLDIGPLWAYQLGCAEFFTNDKVDYIYNAELFRQYIGNLIIKILDNAEESWSGYTYQINGIEYLPDYLSAMVFNLAYGYGNNQEEGRAYIFALFKYNRSLKYKDYFTGARTRPIAIGDTNIDVQVGDYVEVIDVVKNIQKQRFLNIVNKIPRDLKGYTKGIFGKDIAPDWHNPLFLASISETIYGQEIENTGAAQLTEAQTRTSVLKNQGKNIQVRFDLDRNSIIIGYLSFDIPRVYTRGVNRNFMHVDRYDMFNPYLQYTGDQEVYGEEYDARQSTGFGYQGNYMEFKQKTNDGFGGFITALNGWTFMDRYVEAEERNGVQTTQVIGPDFIRSKPSELDRFYISLSGDSMSNYFHFIVDTETFMQANRPMAYNPQILG